MGSVRGLAPAWHKIRAQFMVIYCYSLFSVAMIEYYDQKQLRVLFDRASSQRFQCFRNF